MQMAGPRTPIKEISHDSRTKKLIDGLTEDPEDYPDGFIPIIELHNVCLKKAHLLHEATSDIIQQQWVEGTDLEDIGKFLQPWTPEPYRNKPVPKGMIQALLGIAPNSQVWALTDLSNCIFRNTEAADSIDELVQSLKSLGTTEGPTSQDPIKITPAEGLELVRIFPRIIGEASTTSEETGFQTKNFGWPSQRAKHKDIVSPMSQGTFGN